MATAVTKQRVLMLAERVKEYDHQIAILKRWRKEWPEDETLPVDILELQAYRDGIVEQCHYLRRTRE